MKKRRFKTSFSWEPYLEKQRKKQEQQTLIKDNRRQFEQEMRERRRWAVKKSFNEAEHLESWEASKKRHEKFFTSLALESLSIYDGADSANEVLAQGLGLKNTAIDMEAVEDLAYNIGIVKIAEMFCSSEAANLSQESQKQVMALVIGQLFPPPVPQKPPPNSSKGDQIIAELTRIKNRG